MPVYARSKEGLSPDRWQTLPEHSRNVSALAGRFASVFGSADWGVLAGLLHDLGKDSPEFQARILGKSQASWDHPAAGAMWAHRRWGVKAIPLAFAIAGHHGGMEDLSSLQNERLRKTEILGSSGDPGPVPDLPPLPGYVAPGKGRLDLWIRMLASCLVDADRLDAEDWTRRADRRDPRRVLEFDPGKLSGALKTYLDGISKDRHGPIQDLRLKVLEACRRAAEEPQGHFSLMAPTGAGKTFSSVDFAIRHARKHALRRIIYVSPYITITDQTAGALRAALSPEDPEAILEHHSLEEKLELGAENWDVPIIVTTSVQFYESLFSSGASRCRKLHNIAKSVVILDECQLIPLKFMDPIKDVLKDLVAHYGVTAVYASATQPINVPGLREIVRAEAPKRVKVIWPEKKRPESWKSLAEKVVRHGQVLAIVHRRKDARDLTAAIDALTGDASTYHLSAGMCPVHRMNVLGEIREKLKRKEPCRVVSTQLIEAGVDIDFPVVYRAMAGIDTLAQAAGRCNREGLLEYGLFYIYLAPTAPPPGVLANGLAATEGLLREGIDDIFDPKVHARYFKALQEASSLDAAGIQRDREKLAMKTVNDGFKMIEGGMVSVVIPIGPENQMIIKRIRRDGTIYREDLRRLQPYSVSVLDYEFKRLGSAVERFGDEKNRINILRPECYDSRFGVVVRVPISSSDPRTSSDEELLLDSRKRKSLVSN